jgi:hypothetical protein
MITSRGIIEERRNVTLLPVPADQIREASAEVRTRERLDGLLKFFYRASRYIERLTIRPTT